MRFATVRDLWKFYIHRLYEDEQVLPYGSCAPHPDRIRVNGHAPFNLDERIADKGLTFCRIDGLVRAWCRSEGKDYPRVLSTVTLSWKQAEELRCHLPWLAEYHGRRGGYDMERQRCEDALLDLLDERLADLILLRDGKMRAKEEEKQ